MIKKYFIGISIVLLAVISTYANTISINFYKDINNVKYGRISTNSFGVALEDSVTDGWIDKLNDAHNGVALTTSDGTLSSVIIETIRPDGNGYDTTFADNYDNTAMRGYINAYSTNIAEEAQVSLSNLNANFPNGYKIITYLGGVNQNTGASISLTEGGPSDWDAATDTTYYFKTRYYPDPSSENEYNGDATIDAPTTIYVGEGSLSAPYYNFYTNANGTGSVSMTNLVFYKGEEYTFERLGVFSHPFSISDTPAEDGSYYMGTLSFSTTGTGTLSGLNAGETLTFTIPTGTYTNEIHYYCTAHSGMVGPKLEIGQINSIAGWDGTLVKAVDTTSSVGADTTVADYAVFYNLSADQVTLTLDSIQDGAAGSGGIQIVGSSNQITTNTSKAISINLVTGTGLNEEVTATYGLASHNSEFAGWHNVIDPNTSAGNYWDFSNGSTSSVQVTGFRPNGNNLDSSGNDSDNYDGTPLRGFAQAFKPYNDEVHVTLNNLNENFPNGVKVIAYLAGQSGNLGARVRLSEGGSDNDSSEGWLAPGNNLGTYFYKTRWNPDGSGNNGFHGDLILATATNSALKDATSGADFDVVDYAIWENVTADRVTITLDTLTINDNQQPAGLGGFQIVGEAAETTTPDPEYITWLSSNSLAVGSEDLDTDNDGVANLIEYALGLDPNTDEGNDGITGGTVSTNGLTLSHAVRSGLDHGLTYTVETTDDLKFGTWTNTGVTVTQIDTSGILDQLTHTVTSTNDAAFLRLKVEVE